jgi:hypothetical protein
MCCLRVKMGSLCYDVESGRHCANPVFGAYFQSFDLLSYFLPKLPEMPNAQALLSRPSSPCFTPEHERRSIC